MRVLAFAFALAVDDFSRRIVSEWDVLIEATNQLMIESEVDDQQRLETLEVLDETFGKTIRSSGDPEVLNALCWFLEANTDKTTLETLAGWKLSFFEEFGMNELPCDERPDWLPRTGEAAPNSYLVRSSGSLTAAIATLHRDERGDQNFDEFQESRDELIEVLEVIRDSNQDAIVITLVV